MCSSDFKREDIRIQLEQLYAAVDANYIAISELLTSLK